MIRALSGILIAGLVSAALASSREAAASQDLMYIPLGSAGEVVVVDTSQDKVVGRIKGLPAIHGLAGTPDGKLLIAGSFQEREPGDAVPAKPAGMSEEDHAAHHARPADTGPRLKAVVSTVSVVRTADGSMVRRIDVPGAVHHVAVDPTGRLAVVTHPNQDSISVIDLDSFELVATVESGPLPNYAVFSPGGNRIFVSNAGNDTISIVDAWSWTVQRQIKVGSSPEHLVLSPDGGNARSATIRS